MHRADERDRADERRALDQRAADLVGRAMAPGSAIACLEATNTETVEGACERAVFASPETVAAATRLYRRRGLRCSRTRTNTRRGATRATRSIIAGLRRTIAADRYGLASQVLATRDGCTADACDAFGLVYDDKKLRANMKDRLFDVTVAPLRGELADAYAAARLEAVAGVHAAGPERDIPVVAIDPAGQHHELRAAAGGGAGQSAAARRLLPHARTATDQFGAGFRGSGARRGRKESRRRRRCRSIPRAKQ